jgi:hypothetical protein
MAWTTLTLQVTTPLFNGGADPAGTGKIRPAQEAGVRVASIRGAMRFWFRALAGYLTGPDLNLLASLERRVFGGAADAGRAAGGDQKADAGRQAVASPLVMRIPDQPPVVPESGPHEFLPPVTMPIRDRRRDPSRWLLYLMGQGLADMGKCVILRPYVDVGEKFKLKIGFRHHDGITAEHQAAIETLAFASLWLTCTYGGIGARTRRGFGGVRIVGVQGPLPGPWQDAEAMLTPDLGYYIQIGDDKTSGFLWPDDDVLASCLQSISVLDDGREFDPLTAWGGGAPSFPVLSQTHTRAAISDRIFGNWAETLIYFGEQWRYFRGNKQNANPEAQYEPLIETQEWVDVVHRGYDRFPLGALGLPVVYKGKYVVNVDRGNGSEGPLRRASPLWLRPVGEDNEWLLLSFAFWGEFLPGPDAPGIHLWHDRSQGRQLRVDTADVRHLSEQWIGAMARDGSFSESDRRV